MCRPAALRAARFEIDATQPLAEPVHRGARNRKAALILLGVGAACYVRRGGHLCTQTRSERHESYIEV